MSNVKLSVSPAVESYSVPSRLSGIIGGAKPGADLPGYEIDVINPATEQRLTVLREDDAAAVGQAVAAARQAFDGWSRMDLAERRRVIKAAIAHVMRHADELAYIDSLDTGVPLWDIRGRKLGRVAENFDFFLEVANQAGGETYQQNSNYISFVTREPVGVAAIIAPWNSPMSLASMQIAPCIAFGNTCVVKPSEHAPVSLYRFVELLHEGGLPPGVINLVNGRGPVTGTALVDHPEVDLVKFIGGTHTGKIIMSNAGRGLKEVGLELGGKSANIVFADADYDDALDSALLSIFTNNGQQCLAGSRILVQREIADKFIADFVARAKKIRIGDPLDPNTEMGPLAFREHYERVLSYVEIARSEGATLLTGGERAPGFDVGYYVSPTAVLAPSNKIRVCQDEIFGPFAAFLIFDTVEEAIEIANETTFGLVSYVWTSNVLTAMQVSQAVRAGTIWVNTPLTREVRAPFGGFKESGIGRDGAAASLDFYTEQKTTTIPTRKLQLRKIGMGNA